MDSTHLIGKDLTEFSVRELTEVYVVNEDGLRVKSLGYFQEDDVAVAFAQIQRDPAYHKTQRVIALTNGEFGFALGASIRLFNDGKERVQIRREVLARLTPAERAILGFRE